jgi:hypothetical protein
MRIWIVNEQVEMLETPEMAVEEYARIRRT